MARSRTADPPVASTSQVKCTKCDGVIESGAAICVHCGYDHANRCYHDTAIDAKPFYRGTSWMQVAATIDFTRAREVMIPAILALSGTALIVIWTTVSAGVAGILWGLIGASCVAVAGVLEGLLVIVLASRVLGSSFGYLRTAVLKLVGIVLFTTGLYLLFGSGLLGLIATSCAFWLLLGWLFDLEPIELAVCVVVMLVVHVTAIVLSLAALL